MQKNKILFQAEQAQKAVNRAKERAENNHREDMDRVAKSGIMDVSSAKEGIQVHLVGKINRDIYKCITEDSVTDEVIITDERIGHIKERRGAGFLEKYEQYFPLVLSDPDYIFPDAHVNTAIVCKVIGEGEGAINLILRLAVEGDDPSYKNSILTAIRENARRFAQRLKNKTPVYKKIDTCE